MSDFDELAERAEGDFDLGDFARAVRACRSFRRFDEGEPIPPTLLVALVDLARDVASGANRLPLRYRIVTEASERESVFSQLKWAGALKDWDGPAAGERPTGYIVVCDAGGGATTAVDEGIAAQTILLAATQAGFGGCMLHAFNHSAVRLRWASRLRAASATSRSSSPSWSSRSAVRPRQCAWSRSRRRRTAPPTTGETTRACTTCPSARSRTCCCKGAVGGAVGDVFVLHHGAKRTRPQLTHF